jgi:hypothetical protein
LVKSFFNEASNYLNVKDTIKMREFWQKTASSHYEIARDNAKKRNSLEFYTKTNTWATLTQILEVNEWFFSLISYFHN